MTTLTKDEIIALAKKSGFKASIGKTDKEGSYHPNINALSKDVPIEWLEKFATLCRADLVASHEACKSVNSMILAAIAEEEMKSAELATENAALETALNAVARDAERYRWLRDYLPSDETHCDDAIVAARTPQDLDAVIDEAMKPK